MTILQALTTFYDRLDKRGDAPQPGYMPVAISFAIPIANDGSAQAAISLGTPVGNNRPSLELMVPKLKDHNNSGQDPFLFWDNTGYALGLSNKEMKRGSPAEQFDHFKRENLKAIARATSQELIAFRAFLESWNPSESRILEIDSNDLDCNVVFRSSETGNYIHTAPDAREFWSSCKSAVGPKEMCLVTGRVAPQVRLHPKFPALERGGSKAPIVSFNSNAFESYGKDQGANAPVSEDAAFKYGAALNWLLDKSNARSMRLGETTVVFWADENDIGEDAARTAENAWTEFFDPPDKDIDDTQADAIRTRLANAANLRSAPDRSGLKPETRMYILALSPNSGRIAVRFWLDDTFGHLATNLQQHVDDLAIEPSPFRSLPKAWALLYETAAQRKAENIPPRLGGELAQSILTGRAYPQTLLASVIGRIRADKDINGARASLCKAVINRTIRNNNRDQTTEGIPVALNPQSTDKPYNLGRLFAVYEYAESSVAKRNATIRDKYIGGASATPLRIFPLLMRGYENNASTLSKGEGNQRGSGVKAAKTVSQILDLFDGDLPLPTTLALEDQARFFVGYYHQTNALYTKSDSDTTDTQTPETEGAAQ